ncbi:MAG: choice-of-anchor Q domain-containing protein, partial [Verrucomicrobium sp.]
DLDGDGVSNSDEAILESDPYDVDSDDDGMTDGEEESAGCDPLLNDSHADYDGDRYPNIFEVKNGSDPFSAGSVPTPHYVVDPNGGGTHTTIGEAVYWAYGYEIILVQPGVYTGYWNASLSLYGEVLLISAGGAASTIIDGENVNGGLTLAGNCVIEGFTIRNTAGYYGGAIYAYYGSPTIVNCVFSHNHASYYGGAVYNQGADLLLLHCTSLGNSADQDGQGLYCVDGKVTAYNSIFWDRPGQEVTLDPYGSGSVEMERCIVRGGFAGTGNLSLDPLLTGRGRLRSGSPAVNAGSLFYVSGLDMDGEPRPTSTLPDIGADEWVDSDSDSLPDAWEQLAFGSLSHDGTADGDSDGLNDLGEFEFGSDPAVADADGDGVNDGAEFAAGSDPWLADSDGDTMPDGYEIAQGLDPANSRDALDDRDGDRIPNLYEYHRSTDAGTADPLVPDYTVNAGGGGTHTTIADAISAADLAGDWKVILVKSGSYMEDVTLLDKKIALLGEAGASPPEIVGSYYYATLSLFTGDVVVDGFVIRHQNATNHGQGVYVYLYDNFAAVRLSNCFITGNYTTYGGTGVQVSSGECRLDHCTIFGNNITTGYSLESGISGVGILLDEQAGLRLRNSIVWNDSTPDGTTQIWSAPTSRLEVLNSIVLGGEHGAWGSDPLLDPQGRLRTGSPAINPSGGLTFSIPSFDTQGEARTSPPDLGADEYVDTDSDSLPDWWEILHFGNLGHDGAADGDADGLNDLGEHMFGTDPAVADEDGDGANDGSEHTAGTDPHDSDSDDDTIPDGYEIAKGLNPLDAGDTLEDKDGDRVPNIYEYNRGTDAAVATTLVPDVTVDPAVNPETATVKKTISSAISAVGSAAGDWKLIYVKKGVYTSTLSIYSKRVALLGERSPTPPEIAITYGGTALSLNSADAVVDGFVIRHQDPLQSQRGISVSLSSNTGRTRISNCLIQDNHSNHGAGISVFNGDCLIDHCTIFRNNVPKGSGIYNFAPVEGLAIAVEYSSKLRVRNSVIWNIGAPAGSTQIWAHSYATVSVSSSIILGGEHGASAADPLLDRFGALLPGSPAIDPVGAGTFSIPSTDIHGEARISPPDLGADEFTDSDADGLADWWETRFIGNLASNGSANPDSDGLTHSQEYLFSSNPTVADGDADGAADSVEQAAGTDPWDADSDDDSIPDGYEISKALDPNDYRDALEDKDADRFPNIYEYNRSWDANNAASPAVLTADVTVDPAVVTETATVKKTIGTALSTAKSTAGDWKIVIVKKGVYTESGLVLGTKRILLMSERVAAPAVIASTTTSAAVSLDLSGSVLDGMVLKHSSPYFQSESGIRVWASGYLGQVRVVNCVITGNAAVTGAGIYLSQGE